MNHTISLGRIKGVPVGAHWTLLVIAGFIGVSLSSGLGAAAEDGSGRYALLAAVGATVLFLASVLAHEAGHALVALKAGVPVNRITLWLFGGMAELGGRMPSAGWAFAIAIAGPAVSLGLGVTFIASAIGLAQTGVSDVAVVAVWWLGAINVVLAVFNMLPGAPLDGGRVLAAVLWWKSGRQAKSEERAAVAGRYLGWGMAGFGFYRMVVAGPGDGIWLVLMGLFLSQAAASEQTRARLDGLSEGRAVSSVMRPTGTPLRGWMSLGALAQEGVPLLSMPVRDFEGHPSGVLVPSVLDLVPKDRWVQLCVSDVAVPIATTGTATPDEPLTGLLERVGVPASPVVVLDGGQAVGLVGVSELEGLLSDRTPQAVPPADSPPAGRPSTGETFTAPPPVAPGRLTGPVKDSRPRTVGQHPANSCSHV
jgi:Zn-dependent protease